MDEILRSGFPGIRDLPPRVREVQLDGYLARVLVTICKTTASWCAAPAC